MLEVAIKIIIQIRKNNEVNTYWASQFNWQRGQQVDQKHTKDVVNSNLLLVEDLFPISIVVSGVHLQEDVHEEEDVSNKIYGVVKHTCFEIFVHLVK